MSGQEAYNRDLAHQPTYHTGAARPAWSRLSEIARWSWERNPTDRISPSNPGESPEMTTTNELSVTPNLVVSRESFEKAVEELEACVRNDWMGDDVSRADVRVSRSRLLHLWDDQQAEVERLREMALKPEDAQGNHIYFKGFLSERIIEKIKPLYVSGSPREERSDG